MSIAIFSILFACQSPQYQVVTASEVPYKDGTVAMALTELEIDCANPQNASNNTEELQKQLLTAQKEIELLGEQITRLQEILDSVQSNGVGAAQTILFDPRATTLESKDVQSALTEIMKRVSSLEHEVLDDLGQPGPGLFEIPKKQSKGNQQNQPNQPNQGPQGQGQPNGQQNQQNQGPQNQQNQPNNPGGKNNQNKPNGPK